MICKSDADSNSPLVTCHLFKFSFDPYNALMDVDAILQMRKKRYREVGRFTQGCTASIRAQLSQHFGINTQTLVKLKQSWGFLVPSVTNSYRKKLHLFTHRTPQPLILFICFSCNLVCFNMRMLQEDNRPNTFLQQSNKTLMRPVFSPGVKQIEREHLKTSPSQTWICIWRLLEGKEYFQIRAVVTRLCICQNS